MKSDDSTFTRKFRLARIDRSEDATPERMKHLVATLPFGKRVAFWTFFWIFIAGVVSLLALVNSRITEEVPARGGSFTEGLVGRPAFINPVLAISDTDRDLTRLVYSGILRQTEEGDLIPDLAEKYEVSEDGLEYIVTLKDNLVWHDGEPLSSEDIVFTISQIKDPLLKSPERATWEGVTVESLGPRTVSFRLTEPYAFFPRNFTLGIIPAHVWKNFTAEDLINNSFNTQPVGTGPYKIDTVSRNKNGVAESYTLEAFDEFALGEPYIETLRLKFYPDEAALVEAWREGEIHSMGGISATWVAEDPDDAKLAEFPLTRIFAVFFNQNEAEVFVHKEVRAALDLATDRRRIIREVLGGYGTPIGGPLPKGAFGFAGGRTEEADKEAAKEMLTDAGWALNEDGVFAKDTDGGTTELTFSIATANVPELKRIAELLEQDWEEIGARVAIRIFDIGDLNQEVIRPRSYEALLFGEVISRDPDLFAFWHSSQRLDPGLNIAQLANIAVDKHLEELRTTPDRNRRIEKLKKFTAEVKSDIAAVFLYSPDYLYAPPEHVKNVSPYPLTSAADRFNMVHTWYIETDNVWTFFTNS